jgi:hypothetical protein
MNPLAYIAHEIPGRARIRVPSKQGNTEYFDTIHKSLLSYPMIEDIRVNPVAGSIVINHCDHSLEALKQFALENSLFILEDMEYKPEVLLQRASSGLESFDSTIKNLTSGELDLRSVFFILLIGVGIRQLLIGHTVGPASTLLWQALGLVLATKAGNK